MSAKVIIAGDLCLHDRTAKMSLEELCASHQEIKKYTSTTDLTVINLECSVAKNDTHQIEKAGKALRNSSSVLELVKYLGFDVVTLANNHFADYGEPGVCNSLQQLQSLGIDYVGAGLNLQDAKKILYKTIGNNTIAIINACEHEFTVAEEDKAGCNPLNLVSLYYEIIEARKSASYVIVIIHGGHEHYNLPSPRMQEMYRFFVDIGADAVVNHHQHCYSGYEYYKGKPIVYGLGNFSFDWQGSKMDWAEGYMVRLILDKEIDLELIPYIQNMEEPGIRLLCGEEKDRFMQNVEQLNSIIQNPEILQQKMHIWAEKKRKEYMYLIEPIVGRNIKRLEHLGLMSKRGRSGWCPKYMTEERRLLLKSLFQCESHHEIMNILLNKIVE